MKNKNYGILNLGFIDNIIEDKRLEMFNIIKNKINNNPIKSFLDIGTTEEKKLKSSNFFVKKFEHVQIKKSITDQNIIKNGFSNILKKSITSNFSISQIDEFKSDLVISSATIEHVGNYQSQLKMIKNIIALSNKFFFITTPNRNFPFDFHTKIPFIHMLPKNLHRKILNLLFLKEYAKEENLNLLDIKDINKMIEHIDYKGFDIEIFNIKLLGIASNLIIMGKKID